MPISHPPRLSVRPHILRYDANDIVCDDGADLPSGHVTNYAQNENGQVGRGQEAWIAQTRR